jgi:hypothetical protein
MPNAQSPMPHYQLTSNILISKISLYKLHEDSTWITKIKTTMLLSLLVNILRAILNKICFLSKENRFIA